MNAPNGKSRTVGTAQLDLAKLAPQVEESAMQLTPLTVKMEKCYDRNACVQMHVKAQFLEQDAHETLSTRNSVCGADIEEENLFELNSSRSSYISSDTRSRPSVTSRPGSSCAGELTFRGREIKVIRDVVASQVPLETELQMLRRRLADVEDERDNTRKRMQEAQTQLAEEREDKERTIDNLENALKVERRGSQRIS